MQESVFLLTRKEKYFPVIKASCFFFTGNNFSLTSFLDGYQTWKKKENEFQEFGFLKTNKA
jgi:hypothetical protein